VVEFRDVTFTYEGATRPALRDINLQIWPGEIVAICGPEAAGRTTLCRCINGLVPHFYLGKLEGQVIVNGHNTMSMELGQISHQVGLIFDNPQDQLFCNTVVDEAAFGPENLGISVAEIERRVSEALMITRLTGLEERHPSQLSGGQQQSLAVASILTMRPSVFVLDEPTANLDPVGSQHTLSLVKELTTQEEKNMIIVSHKIEKVAAVADRLIVVDQGAIVMDGPFRKVISENVELMLTLGLEVPQITQLTLRLAENGIDLMVDGLLPLDAEEFERAWSAKQSEHKI
jgi:energy-coupling factor transporter ATP-binding protein EcfA2